MIRLYCRLFAGALAVLLLTSCASSKRMMRLSPLESKDKADITQINLNEDHINLWPMFYKCGAFTSIFWPIADLDSKGVAVRPFFNKEGSEYSILFPLSAWNPVNGDGWALTSYWNDKNIGTFPLFNIGPDFNYVLPFWWDHNWKQFGLLPISYFSKDMNFFGPLWYDYSDSSFGLFPLFWQASDWGCLFPFYNYENYTSEFDFKLLFGVLGKLQYEKKNADYHYRFLNCYRIRKKESTYDGFLPLYLRKSSPEESFFISPLLIDWQDCNHINMSWLHYYEKGAGKEILITPLFGSTLNRKIDKISMMNILGPAYISWDEPDDKYLSFAWPLYFQRKKDDSETIASLPLFYHNKQGKNKKTVASFPLFYYNKDKKKSNFNVLGPLFHRYSYNNYSETNAVWPIFGYTNDPKGKDNWRVCPLVSWNSDWPSVFEACSASWDRLEYVTKAMVRANGIFLFCC
ncbi:MAG: hypothetical protein GY750_09270 [Lentisphaerae bacterium]|nr:hypothetical protein [Lentisphaerota bacterium]MCP4101601.1 hypothetical protein [Lentisphaerota bacterium]